MATAKYLIQQNRQIAYEVEGNGPLVVCVPSLGDLRSEYRFLRPLLVEAGFKVATMDVRGHGESSTGWDDYSVAGVGEDVLALIRALDGGPAVIIGTSMGGGAAIWAAAEAPELVRGMILVDPFVDGKGDFFLKLLSAVMFSGPWGPSMWLKYYESLYPTRKPGDFAEYTAGLQANLKESGRMEAVRQMLYASKEASGQRMAKVTQPALVLMGSKDRDFKDPEGEAKRIAEAIGGEYKMIENAGHYPHAEMPEVTAPLMISFMQSLLEA